MLKLKSVAVVVLLVAVLSLIEAQKKDTLKQKMKIENEEELEMLSENSNVNLPQKQKVAAINKLIKSSKINVGPKVINQKDWKQNRTNVEFVKTGNKTFIVDKETNKTIDEVASQEEVGHQNNWYWWG